MQRSSRSDTAVVGAADHAGWAVLVTVAPDGKLIDRRRVELLAPELPRLAHHHECQALPLPQALELVERVRASAEAHAAEALAALAAAVPVEITAIAIRRCPPLPPTVAERIADYRSQNVADTVLFREALAGAAEARGWAVHWYDAGRVAAAAARALGRDVAGRDGIDGLLEQTGRSLGPPWTKDHRTAMAAAIAAGAPLG